jgi:ATP-dependent helicase/DNAse subunit B
MGKIHIRPQSYSSISLFQNCPRQYKLKYLDGNYTDSSTLPLELGTLLHKVLELKYSGDVSADLADILENGYAEEHILGLKVLKDKYFEDYIATGRKSGLTYNQKIEIFKPRLTTDIYNLGEEWKVLACELPFEIQYDKDIVITGKIDRVDINIKNGNLRVIDYKSSDAVYNDRDLNNALQMYIYSLAIQYLYDKTPVEYIYDFILLGEQAYALTKKNYKTTMQKKLDGLIAELKENYKSFEFKPKPSPLCYWCPFNRQGCVNDKKHENLCDYYSLWTPTVKTFAVNKLWDDTAPPPISKTEKTKEFIW